jgi:hypothetical protein
MSQGRVGGSFLLANLSKLDPALVNQTDRYNSTVRAEASRAAKERTSNLGLCLFLRYATFEHGGKSGAAYRVFEQKLSNERVQFAIHVGAHLHEGGAYPRQRRLRD